MELAVASRLGPLVPEHGTDRIEAHGLGLDLKAVLDVGAQESRRRLGPEGDRVASAVLEGVHLLLDDIGFVADAAREELRPLEEGQPDLPVAVGLEGSPGRRLHPLPLARLGGENVAHPPHRLDGHGYSADAARSSAGSGYAWIT